MKLTTTLLTRTPQVCIRHRRKKPSRWTCINTHTQTHTHTIISATGGSGGGDGGGASNLIDMVLLYDFHQFSLESINLRDMILCYDSISRRFHHHICPDHD